MPTSPDVFIIESLRFEDEEAGFPEGHFISHILRLAGRQVKYYYVRTRKEFEEILDKFEDSEFRYLHLSCHASANGIALTLDNLSINELAQLLRPIIGKRRVFLSACQLATQKLATALMRGTECHSVIGPSHKIDVDETALFWASVYHIMFRNEAESMKRNDLHTCVAKTSALFGVKMRYFTRDEDAEHGWKELELGI